MKKIKKTSLLITILSFVILSCSDDNLNISEQESKNFELSEMIVLNESTSFVSSLLLNMGATAITVTKSSMVSIYEFETEKKFILNGSSIDLSNYSVILKDGMISLKSNPSLKMSLLNGQPYIIKPNYDGFVNDNLNNFKNIDINILILFMQEMITTQNLKINTINLFDDNLSQKSAGCSFWNTYSVFATGVSSSVAEANLADEIAIEEGPSGGVQGCTKIGGSDVSCGFGSHICVATQSYCCSNTPSNEEQ